MTTEITYPPGTVVDRAGNMADTFNYDNFRRYNYYEAARLFASGGNSMFVHSAEDIVRDIFSHFTLTTADDTIAGSYLNALSTIGKPYLFTHDFTVMLDHLDCSYFTPETMEHIANMHVPRKLKSVMEYTLSVVLMLISRGNSVQKMMTHVANTEWHYHVKLFREACTWMRGIGDPVVSNGAVNYTAMVSSLVEHMGDSQLSHMFEDDGLVLTERRVGLYLRESLCETARVTEDKIVEVHNALMSLPPRVAYHIVSTSDFYPVDFFDATLGGKRTFISQVTWLDKGIQGYTQCVDAFPDSASCVDTTVDPAMKAQWVQCVKKTSAETCISEDVLNVMMFYALSVPDSYRSMVMENMDYIMGRFVEYYGSLDAEVSERVAEAAYYLTHDTVSLPEDFEGVIIFSPVMMSVVCHKTGSNVELWCDTVLTMLGCNVLSLNGAEMMMFIVENCENVYDLPLRWVESMVKK